ncbi:MAG: hypothetical protein B6U72_02790 [Candidatus Altiarchaeales archaeon ex4484_2]|nr:MAG: hypothetical protein B6U72_02790 [Candidatus Altiarchaeales archaeon ex4484_2]
MSTETLIERYPLEKRKVLKKTVQYVFGIITGLAVLFLFFLDVSFTLFLVLAVIVLILILFVVSYTYQWYYYRNYFYDLVDGKLVVRKGVISTKQTTVPLGKTQDVYLDQDIFDRLFRLWDLHISSASQSSGFEAHIDGVNEINGRAMYNLLLGETVSAEEKTGVKEIYHPSMAGLVPMMIGSVFMFFFIAVFSMMLPMVLAIPAIIIALFGIAALTYLEFKSIRYEIRADGVFIKKGFISPKESLVLYRNIQDVEESQGLIEIILGIKTLSVKTMTSLSAQDSNLRFLTHEVAEKLREEILEQSRKSSLAAERETREDEVTVEDTVKEIEAPPPYRNHFIKSMIYSNAINYGIIASIIALVSVFLGVFHSVYFFGGVFLSVGIFLLLFIISAISAVIVSMTYSYSVLRDYVAIKVGLFYIRRKQINYNKIQDLVLDITLPQSFAKLASLKLETGSKELVQGQRGKSAGATTSVSRLVESIPELDFMDAVNLRNKVAKLMGVSLQGIGIDSLVSRLPLESIKPFKKTLWWIIYLTPVALVTCIAAYQTDISVPGVTVLLIIYLVVIAGKYVYEVYYYRRYFYDLNDDVLVIRKGVFGSREIVIPFSKIQDIFIDQDILDRALNLRDLYVSTVTGRSILNAHIDGVNPEKAGKIALMIIDRMHGR